MVLLMLPATARGRKGKRYGRHHHARHATAHHRHHRHNRHEKPPVEEFVALDPMSQQFESQKGKLQMPVDGNLKTGNRLSAKYLVYNPEIGIDIATLMNAPVRAVFDGTVSNIFEVEGAQVVIIQHGAYYTVYNNLAAITVSKGDHVNAMQLIGRVGENDDCEPILRFQIWRSTGKKNAQKLDPAQWVACQK